MKYLLDSHALLWLFDRTEMMDSKAIRSLDAVEGPLGLSLASVWELEIKRNARRLGVAVPDWLKLESDPAVNLLAIELEDALAAAALPLHHRDPFDRMIIAQAMRRGMVIVSRDRVFEAYGVPMLWC